MTQVIETDEVGRLTLLPEVLGEVKPHARYQIEMVGEKFVVQPEPEEKTQSQEMPENHQEASEKWMREWRELAEEIGKVWPSGVSATDVVSEMRR